MIHHYRYCETPLGKLLLVANAGRICGTYFFDQKYFPVIAPGWRETGDDAVLNETALQISDYFAGTRQLFALPLAAVGTPFQQAVWSAISGIEYGERISYGELARRVGRIDAVRAAGTATGRNPISLIVPCHRIVGTNGSLTGYAGGLTRKQALLALESKTASTEHSAEFALRS